MPDRITSPGDQSAVLRQLKALVLTLILSNVIVGLFGGYVLHQVDRKYSQLIEQAVPSLNDLQTLTTLETDAMRQTNPVLFTEGTAGRNQMIQRAHAAIARDRELRQKLLERPVMKVHSEQRPAFAEAGQVFNDKAEEVVREFAAADDATAARAREQSLRPAFDRYIAATTKIADLLESDSLRTSGDLSLRSGNISHLMLGLAGWPVMLVVVFFLFVVVFVLGVLLKVTVFGGAEA